MRKIQAYEAIDGSLHTTDDKAEKQDQVVRFNKYYLGHLLMTKTEIVVKGTDLRRWLEANEKAVFAYLGEDLVSD